VTVAAPPVTRADVLSLSETAQLLGIPRSTVADLARRGELPGVKLGKRQVFHPRRGSTDRRPPRAPRRPARGGGVSETVASRTLDLVARIAARVRAQVLASPPRLSLWIEEAAAAVGVSPDCVRDKIGPGVRIVREGRSRLVSVVELQRWLERYAGRKPAQSACAESTDEILAAT
jgi:excisionase family DNA binding protein